MPLTFGTSGLRGPAGAFDQTAVTCWVQAFLRAYPHAKPVFVGRDLRASSPEITKAVIGAITSAGADAIDCGALPTPALALAARGARAIMITGSHIPADRNGLKFYIPSGEILKQDEAAIAAAYTDMACPVSPQDQIGTCHRSDHLSPYAARYQDAYGPAALHGLRIGVYQHSSVARDLLSQVLEKLGAVTVALGRSDHFVAVDTEAVNADTRTTLAAWCARHRLDAIVSTDGDADRPMLTTASGELIPGDLLGVLTAQAVGATCVVTPVSSNSMVADLFPNIRLTRIGSPFVIAAMNDVLTETPNAKVIGFEANGGVILGFDAALPCGSMASLMTRDSLLPIIAPLAAAHSSSLSVAQLRASLPKRATATDRLQQINQAHARAFLDTLANSAQARAEFFASMGQERSANRMDGLRVTFLSGAVVHLRLSGNAPELRIYTEDDHPSSARTLLQHAQNALNGAIAR